MNYAITGNPYSENVIVNTRGVMTDAKVAKLNNATKRPVLVRNWEKERPVEEKVSPMVFESKVETPRDYGELLTNIGITAVNYASNAKSLGAKKLRVNKIVNAKASMIYNNVKREDIIAKEEVQSLVDQINIVPVPQEEIKQDDVRGRHERFTEMVSETKEVTRNDDVNNNISVMPSRMERNALEHDNISQSEVVSRQEPKAGDIDLYNNLLHNGRDDDVSRQLQGARQELSHEKEESRKLAEQYGKAVRELENLKEDLENKRRMKAQQEKRELTETLNNLETLKKENLERTSDLSSIQAEIARLKAERQAMEGTMYEESRSFGRAA